MTATHTATGLETAMNVRSHGQEQQASPTGYEKQRPQWNQAGEGPVPGEEVGRADDAAGEDGQGEPEVWADAVHDGPFRAVVAVARRRRCLRCPDYRGGLGGFTRRSTAPPVRALAVPARLARLLTAPPVRHKPRVTPVSAGRIQNARSNRQEDGMGAVLRVQLPQDPRGGLQRGVMGVAVRGGDLSAGEAVGYLLEDVEFELREGPPGSGGGGRAFGGGGHAAPPGCAPSCRAPAAGSWNRPQAQLVTVHPTSLRCQFRV
ncbi:hypothetical protein B0E38_02540 [Streptomyces sp. 111WW2]|nr:hypothetical protein B0E38_02540 [Streptomyces sp. 111WW2]